MPIDYADYPPNWHEISFAIRFVRAKRRCEWCGAANYEPHPVTGSRVILTVAHLGVAHPDGTSGSKDDKADIRPENLAALCQRCHLNFDRADILHTQASNRQHRQQVERDQAGQLPLFPERILE